MKEKTTKVKREKINRQQRRRGYRLEGAMSLERFLKLVAERPELLEQEVRS